MSTPRRAVPHVREFLADSLTPLGAYRRLREVAPCRFLLESITGGEQLSRFTFIGVSPTETYRLYLDHLEVEVHGERRRLEGPPLEALHRVINNIRADPQPIPFTGGLVGYFGYDFIRLIERLPDRPSDPFKLPIALLARFDNVVVFDHAQQKVLTIANEIEGERSASAAKEYLVLLSRLLIREREKGAVAMPEDIPSTTATEAPSLGDEAYRSAVLTAKDYITAGDIFQVVLARRWRATRPSDPLALYRALRMINPSPYMVLMETPDVAVVGASPEMLVRKEGRRLETRPIAGTRPRGANVEEDRHLAQDLLADPKERAEHVMLVDLGRNDLGKVSVPGSVRVASFMEIEHYSHVMHIVSSVEGEIQQGLDGLDALMACFPAGTLTGAPKIRAMEIIDELEPEARGVYGGAAGYFSYTGDMDTCITIRTLVVQNGEVSVTAGAGIVADSDPEREQHETEDKSAGMLQAVALAHELEECK